MSKSKVKKWGARRLLRALVEWHESQREQSTQEEWWARYPTMSCNDFVRASRKFLNRRVTITEKPKRKRHPGKGTT